MVPSSHFPTPALSPAGQLPSSSARHPQMQFGNLVGSSFRPMTIASMMGTNVPSYPPEPQNASSRKPNAAQAAQIPSPKSGPKSPVRDPAVPASNAEAVAADMHLHKLKHAHHANDDGEARRAVVEDGLSVEAAAEFLVQLGRVVEDGPSDQSAAKSQPQLRVEVGALALESSPGRCECDDCFDCSGAICTDPDCLQDYMRSPSAVAPPTVVADQSDHLYSSESGDEGPLPSAPPAEYFSISCRGKQLRVYAREGNAVLDILRLRKEKPRLLRCRHCDVLQEKPHHNHYVEGYRKLGCQGFEREDTLSPDEDAADSVQHGRHGAQKNGTGHNSRKLPSPPPKLSPRTIKRLQRMKAAWRSKPDPPMARRSSSSESSESDTDDEKRLRQLRQPRHASQRASYPMTSGPHTTSWPLRSTRQTRPTKKALKPSPLKHVENAGSPSSPSPGPHRPSSIRAGKRPLDMPAQHNRQIPPSSGTSSFPERVDLTHEPGLMGPPPIPPPTRRQSREAVALAPSSTRSRRQQPQPLPRPEGVLRKATPFPQTPPPPPPQPLASPPPTTLLTITTRKRPAATQDVPAEQQPASQRRKSNQ